VSERLQYQIAVYVDRVKFKSDAAAEKARVRAIRHFIKHGESIDGVKIVARWRNPDRKVGREWKTTEDAGQSLEDFHQTLHGASGALGKIAERYGL
jgi:hypothetical protein